MIMIPLTIFFIFCLFINPSTESNVSISINPTVLSKSGDSVQIRWSGIDSPSDLDWLGIYSPPDSRNDHFIGYVFLTRSPTWRSGSGSISLSLISLRSNYSFRIFRWSRSEIKPRRQDHDHNPLPGTKHLLASSQELAFALGRGPEQIHLAFTDNDDGMRVMFVTGDAKEAYVKYGESEDKLNSVVLARVWRYEKEHVCDSPANQTTGWRDRGYIHDGVMMNLKKGL